MKIVKKIKSWVIKEAKQGELPKINDNNKYFIFTRTGVFVKGNLSLEKAIRLCENTDYGKWNNFKVNM